MYDQWATERSGAGAVGETADEGVRRAATALVLLAAALAVLFVVRAAVGEYRAGFADVCGTIWGHLTGGSVDPMLDNVVWNQRLPRMLTAVLAGLGLSAAGAAMQSLMKNPLADAYTTGISSGALFGATLSMTMGISLVDGYYGRVLDAFLLAMVPAAVIALISRWRRPSPAMMILAGIAVMYIFNAFQSYLMLRADPNSASSVYTWSIGSVGMTTWEQIPVLAIAVLAGTACLMAMSRVLNAIGSGDDYARTLGVPVDAMRVLCLGLISAVAAGVVSFTGVIGFIGLVSPHIVRMMVGSDCRILIPASALLGACLMLLCDLVGFLIAGTSLQTGVVTAMIGGPLFMAILLTRRDEVWRRCPSRTCRCPTATLPYGTACPCRWTGRA